MKKPIKDATLRTWTALNNHLRSVGEKRCQELLRQELAGRKRPTFVRRIYSRLNKVRADRERLMLVRLIK